MTPYKCHNREPFRDVTWMQTGWEVVNGTRQPVMAFVPFRMSPECHYKATDLGKADKRCEGCRHAL